ncbi:MAG: type VI secretion system tip protein TssI/VgrG, partial [Minicystis sp.]
MATRVLHRSFRTSTVVAHAVLAFREEHALGRPAEATVTVQLADYVDPEEMIGTDAELQFTTGDEGILHVFAGIVEAVTIVGSTAVGSGSVHHVRFHLCSKMALLGRCEGSEIFQELDVKAIVTKVLEEYGVPAGQQEWRLSGSYPKREYCVQYDESALSFVSRLLEEEGIYYHSERHDDGEHVVFEDDSESASPIEGEAELPFRQRSGMEIEKDAIYSIVERRRVVSGKFSLRDYDFERPKLDMSAEAESDVDTDLEVYDFPGLYVEPSEGKRLAQVRLEAEQAARSTLLVESDCTRLEIGRKLSIVEALHDEINGSYVVTSVVHELGYDGAATYNVTAELLPAAVKFRSPRVTPAPIIEGPQTATVVAPKGAPPQEIHTDEHGRCKVKFHWDLGPDLDDKASCWMRVGQLQTSGSMVLPRIDWEVVVEFLEGNPDRPIVTGRLYNGLYMPPYALPEGKTRTSLRTMSTPGGQGSNEIRFEDKAGAEEIMIRAQYDQTLTTANNKVTTIGNNQTRMVKVDSSVKVGADETVKITKGAQGTVGGAQSLSVGGNRKVEVNAVIGLTVMGNSKTQVGGNHFEMDGNPLKALLALAAQKVAEVAQAVAAEAMGKIDAAVQSKVDQVMGPINGLQSQMQQIGAGMQAVADGDLGAAAPLIAQAAGLPASPSEVLGGGESAPDAAEGGEGGGEEAPPGVTAQLGIDSAVNHAIEHGTASAAAALGSALGLDAGGGCSESGQNRTGPVGDVPGIDETDRATGPGHSTSKVAGKLDESVGSIKVVAALTGIHTNVAGNLTDSIGAARAELIMGNRAE